MLFWIARQARSKDAAVRKRAAARLGSGGRTSSATGALPRHVTLLLDLSADPDSGVRSAAYDALGRVADARACDGMIAGVKEIEKLGEPAATEVRDRAANAFQAVGDGAVPALLKLVKDKSQKAREVAVIALGGLAAATAERALVDALQDARSSVRQLAARSLAQVVAPGSVGSLTAAFEHKDPATRRAALEAVTERVGRERGSVFPFNPSLARLARDADRAVREAAVRALAVHGSADAIDALLQVFEGPDRDLRQLAAGALKGLAWQPATPGQRALRAILDGDYQGAAAQGDAAVDPLSALVAEKSAATRSAVAEALGRTGAGAAVRPLLALLQDGDAAVRASAAEALARVGASAVGPVAGAVHEAARAAAPDIILRIGAPAVRPLLDVLEQGEAFTNEGTVFCRVGDDSAADQTSRAAHLLGQLLARTARTIDVQDLRRVAHLRDVVRVRETIPARRREEPATIVDVVVDANDLRDRASAEMHRRKAAD